MGAIERDAAAQALRDLELELDEAQLELWRWEQIQRELDQEDAVARWHGLWGRKRKAPGAIERLTSEVATLREQRTPLIDALTEAEIGVAHDALRAFLREEWGMAPTGIDETLTLHARMEAELRVAIQAVTWASLLLRESGLDAEETLDPSAVRTRGARFDVASTLPWAEAALERVEDEVCERHAPEHTENVQHMRTWARRGVFRERTLWQTLHKAAYRKAILRDLEQAHKDVALAVRGLSQLRASLLDKVDEVRRAFANSLEGG